MFTAALFIIAKMCKHPNAHQLINVSTKWMSPYNGILIAIKRNEVLTYITTETNFEHAE